MASYNKVLLMGNLTRDVELRTAGSTQVAQIGLAVNERYKDKNDQWVERATFVDCEAWGRRGEVMAQYLSKGSPVLIEGRLQLDIWQDKNDGSNRSKLKVVVDNFQFIGGGQGSGGSQGAGTPRTTNKVSEPGDYTNEVNPDDIPF